MFCACLSLPSGLTSAEAPNPLSRFAACALIGSDHALQLHCKQGAPPARVHDGAHGQRDHACAARHRRKRSRLERRRRAAEPTVEEDARKDAAALARLRGAEVRGCANGPGWQGRRLSRLPAGLLARFSAVEMGRCEWHKKGDEGRCGADGPGRPTAAKD
eukprot:5837700-Pleurochrysis_carterae.AAC.2